MSLIHLNYLQTLELKRLWWKTEKPFLPLALWLAGMIAAHSGVNAAAWAMLHLNRAAFYLPEGSLPRQRIYALKNEFIRDLYQRGYCNRVTLQEQDIPCRTCKGTGEYRDGEMCDDCGSSGVYKTIYLYKFVFKIGRRFYTWHQPWRLVNWKVELTDTDVTKFSDERRRTFIVRDRLAIEFLARIVQNYLKRTA